MESGSRVHALAAMDVPDFEAEMSLRSCHMFGPLTLVTRRSQWPILSQQATRMSGERVALMAEAAHVLPPIGAQGLNMSLRDLSCLLDLAQARPDALGDANMLQAYHTARHRDISVRVAGIDLLNRISQVGAKPLRDARAMGLQSIYKLEPVRKSLMQMGLGMS